MATTTVCIRLMVLVIISVTVCGAVKYQTDNRQKCLRGCHCQNRRGGVIMADTKRVDKNCEDCGALMVDVSPLRMFCYDCARKRHQTSNKRSKLARKGKISATNATNPNEKYCKGCMHWGGQYSACCNYIFDKGQRRPCPPGKDCTVKVVRRRKRANIIY